jgi:hypothetical protein
MRPWRLRMLRNMKKILCFGGVLALTIAVWLCLETGGWQTYDYGLQCTKCVLDRYIVEKRLFGITIFRRETVQTPARDYERLFGKACDHIFRKGGFGRTTGILLARSTADGLTADHIFSYRTTAVRVTFDAELRLHDSALALRSFSFIDGLLPADFPVADQKKLNPNFAPILFLFADKLQQVNSTAGWQQILEEAQAGFTNELETATSK